MKRNNSIGIILFLLMGFALIFTTSCKNGADTPTDLPPVLTTTNPTEITHNTATCGGTITSDAGSDVTARGVCWSTSPNPTIVDNKTLDAAGTGIFTSAITGLSPSTTYYVRAYATNKGGTAYGSQLSFTTLTIVTDIDGNVYHAVKIGTQTWMVENLKTTKYRNGSPIPNVTDFTVWGKLTTGAYCVYNNYSNNNNIYGKLYNFYAVSDSRNIAPTGWHIPTDAEWATLTNYLGSNAGGKLKEAGIASYWLSPNYGATNETGFTALPAGYANGPSSINAYYNLGSYGYWWTSTVSYCRSMGLYSNAVERSSMNVNVGCSVRCVKD